ncbi:PEP/pyruvate-binding domain-containing protein [Streptomyces sp. OE57]|uniref:PEP/pyruvate-binding domain-containing protein n=1 Tax=Streptomyces lacaronensis TaxID=3379885 RepID=UPI0039B7656E
MAPAPATCGERFLDGVRELTRRGGARDAAIDVRAVPLGPAPRPVGRTDGSWVSRHVVGPEDALAAVREHLARSLRCRSTRRTAVVAEEFIAADASAQVLSRARGRFEEAVALVRAAHGVAVGGADPAGAADTYLVRRTDLNILVEWFTDKYRQMVPTPTGLVERPLPDVLRDRPCLPEQRIRDMVRIGLVAEAVMGRPVRMELAWKNGMVYVLWCEAAE